MLPKTLLHIVHFIFGLLVSQLCLAQQGFYVPKSGSVFFNGDSATIFSNVQNDGRLGVGKKAVLNFKGEVWHNDQQSVITDESNGGQGVEGTGGVVRFLADNLVQQLIGGYNAATRSGPMFSNLQLDNANGIVLQNSSVKVLTEMIINHGVVHLNGNIFTVGNNNPGTITGYDSLRFFVSGNNGGMLLRENIRSSDGMVVFPIGSTASAYTPAAIKSKSAVGDHYYVSVFGGVQSNLFNGNDLTSESVNKVWQIGKMLRPHADEVEVYLQHLVNEEGTVFRGNRANSYISRFNGSSWDKGFPQYTPGTGYLSSSGPLTGSGINDRTFANSISQNSYFTKFTGPGDSSIKTKLILGAYRVNSSFVRVNWQTKPEVNVKEFIVERRFANESGFKPVDTIASLSTSNINFSALNYGIDDANSYKGISFYRLRVINRDNTNFYSNTVAVSGVGFYNVLLWPNPTPNKFYLIVNSPSARSIVIYNNIGQRVWWTGINAYAQTYVEIKDHHLIPGTYFVSVLDERGSVLQTEKLLIVKQ